MNEDSSWGLAISKIGAMWGGLVGSVSLSNIHILMGIVVGFVVFIFTCLQIFVLWRDKIARKVDRREKHTDTEPVPL